MLAQDAYLSILRAGDRWSAGFIALFKSHGLTQAQFNVLRILRGGEAEGLTCSTIGDRLIHRLPDVTRLIDRMQQNGHVVRSRDSKDGRVVRVRLTPEGRSLVDSLDQAVADQHAANGRDLSADELTQLLELLAKLLA